MSPETCRPGNRLHAGRAYGGLQRFERPPLSGSLRPPNSVRLTPRSTDPALKAILDPRRLLRWVLIGRLCLASAIFIAAVTNWTSVDRSKTLVASLAFAISAIVTVGSAGYAEIYRKRFGQAFLYMQAVFDLLLVTAVVHLTNGTASPVRRPLHPRHRHRVAARAGERRAAHRGARDRVLFHRRRPDPALAAERPGRLAAARRDRAR